MLYHAVLLSSASLVIAGNFDYQYPLSPDAVYATPVSSPVPHTAYAPAYTDVGSLIGENLTYTTWGNWNPNATASATDVDDPYGQASWTKLWEDAAPANFTATGLYSTTVEPTPIPTEDLVRPPKNVVQFTNDLKFPPYFRFGVAGSAAQIEGAVAEEGKSPNIFDNLNIPGKADDYITNENYYLYKQDIARLAAIGVDHYSFSISWTRILPFATPGTPVNQAGIDHYNDVINTCLEYGITPVATLLHFDTPLGFMEGRPPIPTNFTYPIWNYGGYSGTYNNVTFEDAFVHYSKIVLSHFADRVPVWITFNEPLLYTGYPSSIKNVVKASARVHEFYHEELKATGQIGMKFNNNFAKPLDPKNQSDIDAANRFNLFQVGSFANPLYLGQDYPKDWKETFSNYTDFLFTEEELAYVGGKTDFLGIDPYTYTLVTPVDGGIEACQTNESHPRWPWCITELQTREDGWKIGYRSQSYVYITPQELREFLVYLYHTFGKPILIGEFGFPVFAEAEKELGDQLFDLPRSIYYRSFLEATLQAINYDHVDVLGAFAWSFADNWEFGDYAAQFGIQVVNRTTQERFYKKSFFDIMEYYQERAY